MHCQSDHEKRNLSLLLKSSNLNQYTQDNTISHEHKKLLTGWRLVRPSAAYQVPQTSFVAKRRKVITEQEARPIGVLNCSKEKLEYPYMSGYINDDYSYVYKWKLSSKVCGEGPAPSPRKQFPTQTRSTFEIEPALPYRYPDPATQTDISRIVAMQLKPELLVEQLLIESRLRTMSLASFPSLLEGVGVGSDIHKSDSAPLLRRSSSQHQPQVHHREKRRKKRTQVPLEWCALNSGSDRSPQLRKLREDQLKDRLQQTQLPEAFQFNNFSYTQQTPSNPPTYHELEHSHGSNQMQSSLYRSSELGSFFPEIRESNGVSKKVRTTVQQSVPVVEPILDTPGPNMTGLHHVHLETKQPNKLSSLLKLWKNTPVRY